MGDQQDPEPTEDESYPEEMGEQGYKRGTSQISSKIYNIIVKHRKASSLIYTSKPLADFY